MANTIKITRKSRNIGFAWDNSVVRGENGGLLVKTPSGPQVTGTARQCLEEYDNACRINSGGTSWSGVWYVGGKPVASVDGGITGSRDIARQLQMMYQDYEQSGVAYVNALVEE